MPSEVPHQAGTQQDSDTALPESVNPQLWFTSPLCGGRDYLAEVNPHTFPGRLEAFCPHESRSYSVSLADLVGASRECLIWAQAFVVGNEPDPPNGPGIAPEDHPGHPAWKAGCLQYQKTGYWPVDAPNFRNTLNDD